MQVFPKRCLQVRSGSHKMITYEVARLPPLNLTTELFAQVSVGQDRDADVGSHAADLCAAGRRRRPPDHGARADVPLRGAAPEGRRVMIEWGKC